MTLEDGSYRLSRNVGKKLPPPLRNNPEERSSQENNFPVSLTTFEIIMQNRLSTMSTHNLRENCWSDFDQILYCTIYKFKDWWQKQDYCASADKLCEHFLTYSLRHHFHVDYEDHVTPYAIGTWDSFTWKVKRMEREGGADVRAHPFPSTRLSQSRRQTTNLHSFTAGIRYN
jgi:hypothetical protein